MVTFQERVNRRVFKENTDCALERFTHQSCLKWAVNKAAQLGTTHSNISTSRSETLKADYKHVWCTYGTKQLCKRATDMQGQYHQVLQVARQRWEHSLSHGRIRIVFEVLL